MTHSHFCNGETISLHLPQLGQALNILDIENDDQRVHDPLARCAAQRKMPTASTGVSINNRHP
jgi:hypothetical protein